MLKMKREVMAFCEGTRKGPYNGRFLLLSSVVQHLCSWLPCTPWILMSPFPSTYTHLDFDEPLPHNSAHTDKIARAHSHTRLMH